MIEFKPMPCIALRRCTCPPGYTAEGMYDKNCISCRVWSAKTDRRMKLYLDRLKAQSWNS